MGTAYYARRSGPKLRELLVECAVEQPDDRISLMEEVDLLRIMAGSTVKLYEQLVLDPKSEASTELKLAVMSSCRTALSHVGEMVQAAARVRKMNESVVDTEQLNYMLNAIAAVVRERYNHTGLADMLLRDLKEIRLPERAQRIKELQEGQLETMRDDVRTLLAEMDQVVPMVGVKELPASNGHTNGVAHGT